jgi:hypothetical protein
MMKLGVPKNRAKLGHDAKPIPAERVVAIRHERVRWLIGH